MIQFELNGQTVTSDSPEDTPLLWVIRDELKFKGTKYGCGIGACRSCAVHLDGRPVPTLGGGGFNWIASAAGFAPAIPTQGPVELELYAFAGSIGPEQAESGDRVPGVDKRLMLIEPTETGHRESPVAGREGAVAKMLGVGVITVLDRVRTLRRRERTGSCAAPAPRCGSHFGI